MRSKRSWGQLLRNILTSIVYSVDLEVWNKLAEQARIKRTASKFTHDFDCDWQRLNAFSHCVTLTLVLLPQIISYSDNNRFLLLWNISVQVCFMYTS